MRKSTSAENRARTNPDFAPSLPLAGGSGISPPMFRSLRGYALDPSLSQTLQTATISEMIFRVPWENDLKPGPIDEYLEVIDFDPAARCFYEAVDLNDPHLLAQDGLEPSEGTPKFHQQMVYAVARLTIHNFEQALGRLSLWSTGPEPAGANEKNDSHFVQRLRIYPHALREANAYYSPVRKALLFGYFNVPEDAKRGDHMPGSMVFTALSHDVVAHETAHALLDGMHRRLGQPTNQDMLAFHEAFADIVALFQHFTFPDLMRHEMAKTRGNIDTQETQLGQMAKQFGKAIGSRGALREYVGAIDEETGKWKLDEVNALDVESVTESHQRGAILVAAIFEAFLSIYRERVADLLRLYTSGTGILPEGSIHPDLVERLSVEATKAASHVLAMCVRALDYCPPVDLTFGEYLRALITADHDAFREDKHGYRVAFVEAFRRRGIFPRDVRTLSPENLCWRNPNNDERRPSRGLVKLLMRFRRHADMHFYARSRRTLFWMERKSRETLHNRLAEHFKTAERGADDAAFLGVEGDKEFEVHSLHFARRSGPRGQATVQLIAQIIQRTSIDADGDRDTGEEMQFSGGATLIADLKRGNISYCIRKPVTSETRIQRQQSFRTMWTNLGMRSTYFSSAEGEVPKEPFAMLHRSRS